MLAWEPLSAKPQPLERNGSVLENEPIRLGFGRMIFKHSVGTIFSGGGTLPYIKMVGNFWAIDPHFWLNNKGSTILIETIFFANTPLPKWGTTTSSQTGINMAQNKSIKSWKIFRYVWGRIMHYIYPNKYKFTLILGASPQTPIKYHNSLINHMSYIFVRDSAVLPLFFYATFIWENMWMVSLSQCLCDQCISHTG